MKTILPLLLFFFVFSNGSFAQSIDDAFSQKKMLKDFELFKEIRLKGNSGLYTYRTKNQIDSIYTWAANEIKRSNTYRDFYTILCQVTDYEGSLHNGTYWI